jgi:glutaconate CoA-transferase, subunit A
MPSAVREVAGIEDVTSPPPVEASRERVTTAAQVAAGIRRGCRLAVGGSGLARKPLGLVRALAEAGLRDLEVWTGVGGLEVEILLAASAVRTVHATYVGLEALGLAPLFRRGREERRLAFDEWSEWTLIAALRAGAEGAPFAPVRATLGTDLCALHPDWRPFASPLDGEPLLAIPPVRPEVALFHVDVATRDGRAYVFGDAHCDRLLALAAERVYISAERLMAADWEPARGLVSPVAAGAAVAGVVEAPGGARPGGIAPWYRPEAGAVRRLCQELAARAVQV